MYKIDPIYYLLKFSLRGFFDAELTTAEKNFLNDNLHKHRGVIWLNLTVLIFVYWGLKSCSPETLTTLISSLIAPAMVAGGAWFAISFTGVPSKLIDIAITITFWMFAAFLASLTTMFMAVAFISPWQIWPVLAIIFLGIVLSCILYDTTDGFKVGLDESMFKFSRAALVDFANKGIDPDKKTDVHKRD